MLIIQYKQYNNFVLTYLINSTLEMRFDSALSFIHSLKTISYAAVQVHNVRKRMCIIKSATQIKRQQQLNSYGIGICISNRQRAHTLN